MKCVVLFIPEDSFTHVSTHVMSTVECMYLLHIFVSYSVNIIRGGGRGVIISVYAERFMNNKIYGNPILLFTSPVIFDFTRE